MQIPDLLIERSKLTRKITFWKIAAFIAIIGFLFYLYSHNSSTSEAKTKLSNYIGLIRVSDEITENPKFEKFLDEIAEDQAIKALIVQIDSPGGNSGTSEKIYNKLLKIKKSKPIVATIGSIGASGAYLIALAAEKIYALNMSLTGSIGVIIQIPDLTILSEKIGFNLRNYKSSHLKGSPNPLEKSSPEADAALMNLVNDSYDYFIDLVSKNRNIPKNEAKKIADGRVYSGRQALALKLIDEIGGPEDAAIWLKSTKNLDKDLRIQEIEPKKRNEIFEMLINKIDETSKLLVKNLFSSKLI